MEPNTGTIADCLTAALAYSRRGWAVFPLNGKKPATQNGWKDATTDPHVIVGWFAGSPHNVGIATGPSGLLVVDTDTDEALEWWIAQNPPRTAVATTGRGQHWYYRAEGARSTAGTLAPHVDTRGLGGYVVAPPSRHPETGALYAWQDLYNGAGVEAAPPWLLNSLNRQKVARQPRMWLAESSTVGNLQANLNGVKYAPPGRRNDALNVAAYDTRALQMPLHECAPPLVAAGMAAGLGWEETVRTVASGLGEELATVLNALEEGRK